jgi:hypothetical protein
MTSAVPVFLCVDLEPVEREMQLADVDCWRGVDALVGHLEGLRPRLAEATGNQVEFLWFLRCDPQIEVALGSPDDLLERYGEMFDRLRAAGDGIGLHVHPWRWDDGDGGWVADYSDPAWVEHCLNMAFECYRSRFGSACELHRFGDRWFSSEAIPLLERLGVRYDLTIEPGARTLRSIAPGEQTRGSIPDYTRMPRQPYRPQPGDFRRPDPARRSGLWIVPLTAADPAPAMPWSWRIGRRVRFPFRPTHRPLQMFRNWTSAKAFWDLVERHVASLERPYLAFAIRSGDPDSPDEQRVQEILSELPGHSVAARLRFTTPEVGLASIGYEP